VLFAAIRRGLWEKRKPDSTQFPFVFACLRVFRRELASVKLSAVPECAQIVGQG
jgi:hypothetical protein